MTTTQQLVQGENTMQVIGYLAQNNLKKGTTNDGRNYINGNIEVKVSDNEQYRIDYFTMEKKSNGEPNKIYESLETAMNKVSLADIANNAEYADQKPAYVQASGSLDINDWYSEATDQVNSFAKLSGLFLREARPDKEGNLPKPQATFRVAGFISKKFLDEESESMKFTLMNVDFRGNLIPVELTTYGSGVEFIESVETGEPVYIYGEMENIFERVEKLVEMEGGFGEPEVRVETKTKREWVAKGGRPLPPEQFNYDDVELVRTAVAQRETMLSGKKDEFLKRKKGGAGSNAFTNVTKSKDPLATFTGGNEAREKVDTDELGDLFANFS